MKSEISCLVHLYFTVKRSINILFGLVIPAKSFKRFNWYYLKTSIIYRQVQNKYIIIMFAIPNNIIDVRTRSWIRDINFLL